MKIYSLDVLLFLFGTSLLFHVGRLKLDRNLRPLSFLLLLFSNCWLPRPRQGIYTEIPPISLAYFPPVLDYLRRLFSLLVFFSTDFQAAIYSTLTFIKYWLTYFNWRIITLQYWSDFLPYIDSDFLKSSDKTDFSLTEATLRGQGRRHGGIQKTAAHGPEL